MYVQVRFELVYGSETSCLTVHLHEKAQIDASFDLMLNTQNKKIEKVMVGHEKDAHLNNKEEDDYQNNPRCTRKILENG